LHPADTERRGDIIKGEEEEGKGKRAGEHWVSTLGSFANADFADSGRSQKGKKKRANFA
jgi:hypothetical protein